MDIPLPAATPVSQRQAVWRTVVGCEWRLLRNDAGWWLALLLMAACAAYALAAGQSRLAERRAVVEAARQDETRRGVDLRQRLSRIENGQAQPPSEAYADPRNALAVGRGGAATVVTLADAPLAATAVGLSDLYPPALKVAAGSQDRFLFVDEIANPGHLLSGSFDLAFVIVYLYPLLLLALSYNILSAESEQGTLALTAASSAPLASVLSARLAVRTGGLALALIATVAALLAGSGALPASRDAVLAAAALAATVLLYGLFWAALALAVNSLRRDSAFNAVALVMAWVLLLLVLPAGLNALTQVLYPAPARAEMVLAVRQSAVEVDREAEQAQFREEHRGALPASGAASAAATGGRGNRALSLMRAADRRADAVLARHEAQTRRQRDFADRLAWLAPPLGANDALAELAGNGQTRWSAHLKNVFAFHERWQKFFVDSARGGAMLTVADYGRFPRFDAPDLPALDRASGLRVLSSLGWLALLAVVLLAAARRRLSRSNG